MVDLTIKRSVCVVTGSKYEVQITMKEDDQKEIEDSATFRQIFVEFKERKIPLNQEIADKTAEYVKQQMESGNKPRDLDINTLIQWLDQNTKYSLSSATKVESDEHLYESPY